MKQLWTIAFCLGGLMGYSPFGKQYKETVIKTISFKPKDSLWLNTLNGGIECKIDTLPDSSNISLQL
jgi:hypothetical protein